MFGANTIVGKSFFTKNSEAQAGKLFVTSMFFTLQGEGPYRGEPAFFIRLAKCNLACSFCDTYFDDGEWLSVDEIAERVEESIKKFFNGIVPDWARFFDGFKTSRLENVPTDRSYIEWNGGRGEDVPTEYWVQLKKRKIVLVITGGEPTLQANLLQLLQWGEGEFYKTQIESNGIVINENSVPASTTVVVSPKCAEQQVVHVGDTEHPGGWYSMQPTSYIRPTARMLERADCLKFVMEAPGPVETDPGLYPYRISPYSTIPEWAHEWAKRTGKPIFISPMNVYLKEPQRAKDLRARTNNTTIEQRSTEDEVISFWEEGLLDMKANQRNHEWAAKYAIQHGFIFNVQIHLLASVA